MKYAATAATYRGDSSQKREVSFGRDPDVGLPHGFTLYGGTQFSSDYRALALGTGANFGDWGRFPSILRKPTVRWRMRANIRGNRCAFYMPNP